MKVVTIGLGYIGLPTSIMFAKYGANVIGVDINKKVVNGLNKGELHIEEPFLKDELMNVIESKKFLASTEIEEADAFIIAVPTPNNNDEFKSCDLSYVLSACNNILPYIRKGNVVIVESTIAPKTMDDFIKPLFESKGFIIGEEIFLVHCPERVLPGQIMKELINNNRIIGGMTEKCAEKGAEVYSLFVKGEMILTNCKTAEMSKLIENTYRDVNIALANELVKISNKLEINALDVIQMANKHPRVNIHTPGPGVGGHCLAVDPYFIISKDPEHSELIQKSREINNSMPHYVISIVEKIIRKNKIEKITVLGMTYKGDVDDIRESPAVEIIHMLKEQFDVEIVIHDPFVETFDNERDINKAVNNSSLLLVLSDHTLFKDMSDLHINMKDPIIFDTKNIVKQHNGFEYFNFGNIHEYIQVD